MIFKTFWIKRVTLWLYDNREKEFLLVNPVEGCQYRSIGDNPGLIQLLKDRDYPILLDDLRDDKNKD